MRRTHIDRALQKLVWLSLQQQTLTSPHYPGLSGHSKERRMYDTTRWNYFLSNMALDVYNTVNSCKSCAMSSNSAKHGRLLHLFVATGSVKFVAMDILSPLPKKTKGMQHVIIVTNLYPKSTQAVFTAHIATDIVAAIFSKAWVISYGILAYLLTNNGSQFLSRFFEIPCNHLDSKQIATTTYNLRANGQVERYSKTNVS